MLTLPAEENSYWIESSGAADTFSYPALKESLSVDVAVVGAGIAGLTTAYLLKRAGVSVAVIEKATVGSGVTGHTTGKVTSQHGLCYSRLVKQFGNEAAKLYGEVNQAAVEEIEAIIRREKIECEWRREDNYVLTDKPEEVEDFKREADIAAKLGLPARFIKELNLPLAIEGAVSFQNQATFHPRKYLNGLAKAVYGGGCYVFENSQAVRIDHRYPPAVYTKLGKVTAKDIIVASHVPFAIPSHAAYAALEYPLYSHIIAAKMTRLYPGMYITSGNPIRSILPVRSGKDTLLFVGGGSFLPGLGRSEKHYRELAEYAEKHLGMTKIDYKWRAYDYLGYDEKPLVGKLFPWTDHTYVATGFMKWGLTNGTAAGMILRDTILGVGNAWAPVFDSNRLSAIRAIPRAAVKIMKLTLDQAK